MWVLEHKTLTLGGGLGDMEREFQSSPGPCCKSTATLLHDVYFTPFLAILEPTPLITPH
jgi:hypothetical protein